MRYLRQSTATAILLGPFLDDADGKTAESSLTVASIDVDLYKTSDTHPLTKTDITPAASSSSNDMAHVANGFYSLELTATNTDTAGRCVVTANISGALPVWHEFMVLPTQVYDSLIAGSDRLQVDTLELSSDSTAADNAESFFDGTGYAGTNNVIPLVTTTTNLTNAPTAGDLTATMKTSVTTAATAATPTAAAVTGAVGSVTGNVGGNVAGSIGSLGAQAKLDVNAEVDTALTDYDAPTFAELDARTDAIDIALTLIAGYIDTEVAAIKAKTDALPADPADASDIAAAVAAIQADTNDIQTRLPAALVSGRMDSSVGDIVTAIAQAIADEILKRGAAHVDGASPETHSLYELIESVFESLSTGTNWAIYKTDGSTLFNTRSLTLDSAAQPIKGVS